MLPLNVTVQQQLAMLLLDISVLLQPLLPFDVPVVQQPVLLLKVSVLQHPVVPLDVFTVCICSTEPVLPWTYVHDSLCCPGTWLFFSNLLLL